MEIPDIIVVNKADHPLTDTMVREIKGVLALGPKPDWPVPILRTEAVRGEGVAELVDKLDEHRAYIESEGTPVRAPPAQPAQRGAGDRHLPDAPRARGVRPARTTDVRELLDRVVSRELDPASAAATILEREKAKSQAARKLSASSVSRRTPKPVPPLSR